MSLHDRSLEVLARTLSHALLERRALSGIDEGSLGEVILRVLQADRQAELDIDDAAKALIRKHAPEIAREGMDAATLFRKFKMQIAKERGFTL